MRCKAQGSSWIPFQSTVNLVPCWLNSIVLKAIPGPGTETVHNIHLQCLIQSDVEQLLGAPSVHSFALVYLISSQLLLKATDLDWVQVNPFTTEAVDNIHLL